MSETKPVKVLCIYRVKPGKHDEFRSLLDKHWPTLDSVGLVTSEPAKWWLGSGKDDESCFVEIFEWKDAKAPDTAHELPEIMAVWEPMGALCDDMEFIHLESVA